MKDPFAQWLAAQIAPLITLLVQHGVPERDAPDLAAEVVTIALRSAGRLAGWPAAQRAGWMRGAARNLAREHARQRAIDPALPGVEPDEQAPAPFSAAENSEAADLFARVRAATTPERWAVLIAAAEGVTPRELARETGEKAATLYNRLRLARRDVLQALRLHAATGRVKRLPRKGKRRSRRLPRRLTRAMRAALRPVLRRRLAW